MSESENLQKQFVLHWSRRYRLVLSFPLLLSLNAHGNSPSAGILKGSKKPYNVASRSFFKSLVHEERTAEQQGIEKYPYSINPIAAFPLRATPKHYHFWLVWSKPHLLLSVNLKAPQYFTFKPKEHTFCQV